jgi:hypothetical protein
MDQVPVGHTAIDSRVLAHRRDNDSVRQSKSAHAEGLKQSRPAHSCLTLAAARRIHLARAVQTSHNALVGKVASALDLNTRGGSIARDRLHTILWDIHFYLALVLFMRVLLHIAAAFLQILVRRNGVFQTMA